MGLDVVVLMNMLKQTNTQAISRLIYTGPVNLLSHQALPDRKALNPDEFRKRNQANKTKRFNPTEVKPAIHKNFFPT